MMLALYDHRTMTRSAIAPPSLPIAYACLALSMSLVGSYVALSKPLAAVLPVFLLAWLQLWDWRGGHAALAAQARRGTGAEPAHPGAVVPGVFAGEFSVHRVHDLRCEPDQRRHGPGVIMAGIPAAVALMSWAFLRERIAPRTWFAVALAVARHCLVFAIQKVSIQRTLALP